jgi:GT2 family glycosyltransferase
MKIHKTTEKITVIIVNYNSSVHTNKLNNTLNKISKYVQEILIIDNNSNDTNKLLLNNKTRLIKNKINYGFAKAVNQGIKISKNEIILLINPDCLLENDSILKSLNKILSNNKIGAIGGKIKKAYSDKYHLTANSKPNFLTGLFEFTNLKKIFPNNPISRKFWIEKTYKSTKPVEVNSLCGAYIILRKKLGNKLNMFDERYFLYMEDIDFGDKINKEGYKVIFDPESEITHIGGASSGSKYRTVLKYWYTSRKKYFQKHLNPLESSILTTIFTLEEQFLKIYHKIKAEPYE